MEFVGIGLDIIDIAAFGRLYQPDDIAILERCFTPYELSIVGDAPDRAARLAGRFAAKEATFKVIGGLQQGLSMTDIEVLSTPTQPKLVLTGGSLEKANELRIRFWSLSITHSTLSAAAVVVALR